MTLLRVAASRATPMMVRAGRQQVRLASGGAPHFDPFSVDPNNKRQVFLYYTALLGALSAPLVAVRYQLSKYKDDKRSFG